jgi:S1-C subfamily serine protease/predicted esterase
MRMNKRLRFSVRTLAERSSFCQWGAILLGMTVTVICAAQPPVGSDLATSQEQAIQAAVARIAPSIVQIETSGGTEMVGSGPQGPQVRKATGPTTGLVIEADGYIITSAYNFANKPTAVFVAIPGRPERLVARTVATDHTRMLTLLKVDASALSVPPWAPKLDIRVGQTAIALGRTWVGADELPTQSVGIISALGRIWGKAIQTDAKVSPVNYGGPLVDIGGRVMGVLVPASPQGQDETAGVEWYDSGIGFAIPMEDIHAVLGRLKQGQDLRRGLLGFAAQNPDIYGAPPVIAAVVPDSAAAKAGLKVGDLLTEVAGMHVERQAQVMHVLGGKYEGDTISVKVRRGKDELSFAGLTLTGALNSFAHPFLGILPMRDDPTAGVELRYVFPKSPAEEAKLKAGDRLTTIAIPGSRTKSFLTRDQFSGLLDALSAGSEVELGVRRQGASETTKIKLTLAALTAEEPRALPEPASFRKALTQRRGILPPHLSAIAPKPTKKAETGYLRRTNAAADHEFWLYVPTNYDPDIAHALVIWLHAAGRGNEHDIQELIRAWQPHCEGKHVIIMGPRAQNDTGWLAGESDFVVETAKTVMAQYTVDPERVVACGMGIGGQMALYLAFHARDVVRGVAAAGALLATPPADNVATERLAFYLVASASDPMVQAIREYQVKLAVKKYPVVYKELSPGAHSDFEGPALEQLFRWLDALDRL